MTAILFVQSCLFLWCSIAMKIRMNEMTPEGKILNCGVVIIGKTAREIVLLPQFNTCSSSGVFDRLLVKKSFDLLWLFLNASHMGFGMFFKLSIPFCRRSFGKGRFQIPVQLFVGIQVWTVAWQIKDFNKSLVFRQPLLQKFAVMNT